MTMTSIRVNPASRPHRAALCRRRSHSKIIEAEHGGEQCADDAGDGQAHRDGDYGYRQRDDALHDQPSLLVMKLSGLQAHHRQLCRFLAELQQMDRACRKDPGIRQRARQTAAAFSLHRSGVDCRDRREIAERLQLAGATLSFHLKELAHAQLVSARQAGRFIYYSANYQTMNGLIDYLTRNCCKGVTCDIACAPTAQRKRRSP